MPFRCFTSRLQESHEVLHRRLCEDRISSGMNVLITLHCLNHASGGLGNFMDAAIPQQTETEIPL